MIQLENLVITDNDRLFIFAYGSLIWKPNFEYHKRWIGYIQGYERRFYQKNTTHRGTKDYPGRVATIVPTTNPNSRVWGCAYEIIGKQSILQACDHLITREVVNGGYKFIECNFFPIEILTNNYMKQTESRKFFSKDHQLNTILNSICFNVITSIAGPDSNLYAEERSLEKQAREIAMARGSCGNNIEYLIRIIDFMRFEIPLHLAIQDDAYIFNLGRLVQKYSQTTEETYNFNNLNECTTV